MFLKQHMESSTWGYIQKYPKQTKRLLGIDYKQLVPLRVSQKAKGKRQKVGLVRL